MDEKTRHPESVVKCACGKIMRLKDRGSHFKTCNRSLVSVNAQDINALLSEEVKAKKNTTGEVVLPVRKDA
jgi:hypothetical protein